MEPGSELSDACAGCPSRCCSFERGGWFKDLLLLKHEEDNPLYLKHAVRGTFRCREELKISLNGGCPFLDGHQCGIYDQRPQACRDFTCHSHEGLMTRWVLMPADQVAQHVLLLHRNGLLPGQSGSKFSAMECLEHSLTSRLSTISNDASLTRAVRSDCRRALKLVWALVIDEFETEWEAKKDNLGTRYGYWVSRFRHFIRMAEDLIRNHHHEASRRTITKARRVAETAHRALEALPEDTESIRELASNDPIRSH